MMKLADLRKLAEMMEEEDGKEVESPETEKEEKESSDPYSPEAVQEAVECLLEAEKVKDDVKLMALVEKELRKKKKVMSSIADLKDHYVEMTIKAPEEDLIDEDGEPYVTMKRSKDDGEDE